MAGALSRHGAHAVPATCRSSPSQGLHAGPVHRLGLRGGRVRQRDRRRHHRAEPFRPVRERRSSAGLSRVVYNRLEGFPLGGGTIQGCDGHGTINAHIIAGFNDLTGFPFEDADGYNYGLGIAPFVKVGSSVIFDSELHVPELPEPPVARLSRRRAHQLEQLGVRGQRRLQRGLAGLRRARARRAALGLGGPRGGQPADGHRLRRRQRRTRSRQPARARHGQERDHRRRQRERAGHRRRRRSAAWTTWAPTRSATSRPSPAAAPPPTAAASPTSSPPAPTSPAASSRPTLRAPTGQAAACFDGTGVCGGPVDQLLPRRPAVLHRPLPAPATPRPRSPAGPPSCASTSSTRA